eukprot:11669701-Alexandrium_andersonii.AAC.1
MARDVDSKLGSKCIALESKLNFSAANREGWEARAVAASMTHIMMYKCARPPVVAAGAAPGSGAADGGGEASADAP